MRAAVAQVEIKEYSSGHRYEGQLDQGGKIHGQGVLSHGGGERYEGEFRKAMYHGHGTMTHPDGRVESGQWKDSKFLG